MPRGGYRPNAPPPPVSGQFKPGQSGNPGGARKSRAKKPSPIPTPSKLARQMLKAAASGDIERLRKTISIATGMNLHLIIDQLIAEAAAGNATASKALLELVVPKATGERVASPVTFPAEASASERIEALLSAAMQGDLSVEASQKLAAMVNQAEALREGEMFKKFRQLLVDGYDPVMASWLATGDESLRPLVEAQQMTAGAIERAASAES